VVGIVGRTPSVVADVAAQLAIPYHGTDWQAALLACQPDIVSIATPGGAHYEPKSRQSPWAVMCFVISR
jgi:predicted dehydrogenase